MSIRKPSRELFDGNIARPAFDIVRLTSLNKMRYRLLRCFRSAPPGILETGGGRLQKNKIMFSQTGIMPLASGVGFGRRTLLKTLRLAIACGLLHPTPSTLAVESHLDNGLGPSRHRSDALLLWHPRMSTGPV